MKLVQPLFAAVIFLSLASSAYALSGTVVSVADGDTLTVLDASLTQHRVRLVEIDAPESNQAFGQRSKQGLASLCFKKSRCAYIWGRQISTCAWHRLL